MKHFSPNMPANVNKMFNYINYSINLQWLGYQGLFEGLDERANEQFSSRYESSRVKSFGATGLSVSDNIGLYLFALLIVACIIVVWVILRAISTRAGGCKSLLTKITNAIGRTVFFNSFLRIMITGSLGFDHMICSVLFILSNAEEQHRDKGLLAWVSICFIIMVVIPPLVGFLLLKYRSRLQESKVKTRVGSLYYSIRTRHIKSTLYASAFMTRRMLLVMVAVFLSASPNWLIIAFVEMQVMYMVYLLASRPHYWPSENIIEFVNETILLIFGYLLILSTDYVPIPELQYEFGWFGARFIGFVILIDLIYMVLSSLIEGFFTKKHQIHLK
mmetsp:Transcript_99811/g.137313  ORF Transcript_99811/g.137313 Transcript_99811/m.137313 type:complete len:331 (-) Transcript_99811:1281-2273(-)